MTTLKDSIYTPYQEILDKIKRAEVCLTERFNRKLTVNPDLDRTLVSFQANKKENGYRWCKYKEGFSAALISYTFGKTGLKSGRILDPFAGSGTTLFVARDLGVDSVGIELLPSSAEIIEVRKLVEEANQPKLAQDIRRFEQSRTWEKPGKSVHFPHLRITTGAFPEETEKALGRYLHEISKCRDKTLCRVLRLAALSILESISYTRKDGQYLRWDSRSGRQAGTTAFNKGPILGFAEAISSKLEEIASDLNGESSLFADLKPAARQGKIKLYVGSCLDLLPKMVDASFDGILTSPPYCNRYDYTRTYALELAMLGIDEEGIRDLRQNMLSCTVENREKKDLDRRFRPECFRKAMKALGSQEVLSLALSYLEMCRDGGALNNPGIPRMVRNYFLELALVIFECARVLKKGAPLVMVNDNVRYQGAHLPVDLILSDFAEKAGFDVEAIWVLPRGKGNSSQQMGVHGREELRKCVYIWRARAL